MEEESVVSFSSLGISGVLGEAISALGWSSPTEIQAGTLQHALQGRDVIGLAETGDCGATLSLIARLFNMLDIV